MEAPAARRRDFQRMLLVSVAGHAALLYSLSYAPKAGPVTLPGVIAVELVAPPSAPVPTPARSEPAKTAAVTPPKPPPPKPKKIVLPKEPSKPAVPPPSKPKEAPPKVVKPPPEPAPEAEEKDLSDVLADLRSEVGEEVPAPTETARAPAAASAGRGVPISPEVASWMRRAKLKVRQSWVVPPGFRTQALETHVVVELGLGGEVIGEPRVTRRSGNPWYDEGVVRAIGKASPLPPPPEAGEWAFVFVPEDSY